MYSAQCRPFGYVLAGIRHDKVSSNETGRETQREGAQVTSGDNAGAHPETVPDRQASLWAKPAPRSYRWVPRR
jgi:hypothetical protein